MEQVVERILKENNIAEPWSEMETTGLANHIFTTATYILRIPTDHPEALPDALTESVAAPVVYNTGIHAPKLVVFDNSRTLIPTPYSIWEKVIGRPLGALENFTSLHDVWRRVGLEVGRVHVRVTECADPDNWLDSPERDYSAENLLEAIEKNPIASSEIKTFIRKHGECLSRSVTPCFIHGDMHEYNIICTMDNSFAALIDWGDAGWGDPTIDFYTMPWKAIESALSGYAEIASVHVDKVFLAKVILDQIWVQLSSDEYSEEFDASILELYKRLCQAYV